MTGYRLKTTDPLVVAVRAYRGDALGVGEAFERVLSWADVYHLEQWGPLIGVYDDAVFDAPRAVETRAGEISAEAWLPLPPSTPPREAVSGDVEVRVLAPENVAACVHRGFPDQVGEAVAGLLQWVEMEGFTRSSATHRQVYLQAPKGKPGEWEIEVQVPVRLEPAEPRPPRPPEPPRG